MQVGRRVTFISFGMVSTIDYNSSITQWKGRLLVVLKWPTITLLEWADTVVFKTTYLQIEVLYLHENLRNIILCH